MAVDGAPLTDAQAREQIRLVQIASPFRLSTAARAGRIRYTLHLQGDSAWNWPRTAEQRIESRDGRTVVTVCADCGDEALPDAASLARYLMSNPWVDSDTLAVRVFARDNATRMRMDEKHVSRQMRRLVEAVQKRMGNGEINFSRYDSASAALKSASGDCTEYAVLLAAAARARGIPTRLVYGVAYASRFTGQSHTFSPHVWVQAWKGQRWTSYDAGLGRFDAGHIALYAGDGSTAHLREVMQAIGRLRIDAAVGVTIQPAPISANAVLPDH